MSPPRRPGRTLVVLLLVPLLVTSGISAGVLSPSSPAVAESDESTLPAVAASTSAGEQSNRTVWQRRYGQGTFFRINDAVASGDGYVLVGDTVGSDEKQSKGVVMAIDASGEPQWRYWFNGSAYSAAAVERRPGGGVVVAGVTSYDSVQHGGGTWAAWFSATGNRTAFETYGAGRFEDLVRSPNGGYLAVGKTSSSDSLAIRIDRDGTEQWRKDYHESDGFRDVVRSIEGQGYVVIGKDTAVHRLDRTGRCLWRRTLATNSSGGAQGSNLSAVTALARRADGYLVGANNGTVVSLATNGSVLDSGRIHGLDAHSIQSILSHDDRVYFGSPAGLVRVHQGAGDFPGTLEHHNTEVMDAPLLDVETILPAGNGFYFVAGTVEDPWAGYTPDGDPTEGYARLTDQRAPTATVDGTPSRAEVGVTEVTLTVDATDNDGIGTYRWDFDGDGERDKETASPTVTTVFTEPGRTNATVEVLDYDGNLVTVTERITAVDTTPPDAVLSEPSPRYVATTAPAILDARGSSDNHEVATYRWDFDGDGEIERETNTSRVRHHFTTPGTHEVGLTVVDPTGHTDTRTVRLQTAENGPPNVSVHTIGRPIKGDKSRLMATTDDRVGTPNVTWEFPDGSQARGHEVYHTFAESGNQTVTVVATDEYGATRVRNVTLAVRDGYPSDDLGPVRSPLRNVGPVLVLLGFVLLVVIGISRGLDR